MQAVLAILPSARLSNQTVRIDIDDLGGLG